MGETVIHVQRDARRLLYAVSEYTGSSGEHPWLKEFVLSAIVCLGTERGTFREYDPAPSLYSFRGVKMFAMLSQEALADLDVLFRAGLLEKLLLNTRHYSTITAVRATPQGREYLDRKGVLTPEDRAAVDALIRCGKCGKLYDFPVFREEISSTNTETGDNTSDVRVRLVMSRVCPHQTKGRHRFSDRWHESCRGKVDRLDSFFGIGSVSYAGTAFFIED